MLSMGAYSRRNFLRSALLAASLPLALPRSGRSAPAGTTATLAALRAEVPKAGWTYPIGQPIADAFKVRYPSNIDDGYWHGMPLGGFGAGCIGRSHRGDFTLWHLDSGDHYFRSQPVCQFALFEQSEGAKPRAKVLCTEKPADGSLGAWDWTYPKGAGTYAALYPRSWFTYEGFFNSHVQLKQFSPIIPNNYKQTSYPVAVFEWTAFNPTDQPVTLSILVSWENMVGWFTNQFKSRAVKVRDDDTPVYDYEPYWGESTGNFNSAREENAYRGLTMSRASGYTEQQKPAPATAAVSERPFVTAEGDGQFVIATTREPDVEITYHTRFDPTGNGLEVWQPFATTGRLGDLVSVRPAAKGERIAAAMAVRLTLKPGELRVVPMALAWDLPIMEFAQGVRRYRYYTKHFDKSGRNAWKIATEALDNYADWDRQIQEWQNPVLADPSLPDWYKQALFNELYYLTSGGTLWENGPVPEKITSLADIAKAPPGQGRFAVLESIDYRWYDSLDVRLYGSFALLINWPEIDKAVLRSYADAVPDEDDSTRIIGYTKTVAKRKSRDALPHDLGAPNEDPWIKNNYTTYQDCNLWKDLPCDFVLQVYRDYVDTGKRDLGFVRYCWPASKAALVRLKTTFDQDGDGFPENGGPPDCTYDAWPLKGISAYCGGLWLAALLAAVEMGKLVGDAAAVQQFGAWYAQAQPLYEKTLWNGRYYRIDSQSKNSEAIMADQLCGEYYAQVCNLADIVPEPQARSALETVYQTCFVKFYGGRFGCANGTNADGSFIGDTEHPSEVWTGINFGLAAFMIRNGMRREGMAIAEAVVANVYGGGLQFRTPEALTPARTFRACMYLRPMAIWAMQHSLSALKSSKSPTAGKV
ncbi:gll2460 [Gloeobacter violaceus PCC 7421]|uniref:Gll2460 protein n=2 Tax=Gloeobacter violaceus TaxID=33072 RepID=Q7NHS5_GLOVI|nr:gll2460 [Gloeobacter violaceus PCC 7421]